MTTPIADSIRPEVAQAENARRELRAKLAGLGDLSGKKLSPEQKEKKLREACEGFESVFIQKMWQEMRKTVPQDGLLHGREEKFWQDMYDQELAKKMTSAGGVGLADMMYRQLSRNLVSATRGVTGMMQGSNFMPSAAPLLPESAEAFRQTTDNTPADASPARANKSVPSVYDGIVPRQGVVDEKPAAQNSAVLPVASPANAAVEDPPEVAAALAQLRLQHVPPEKTGSGNVLIEAVPAGQGVRRQHYPQSGLDLARTAQREAGTKLGPGSVRPPLYPGRTADAATEGRTADGGEQTARGRKVRYTTNTPSGKGRRGVNEEILRAVQAQGAPASPPPLTASGQETARQTPGAAQTAQAGVHKVTYTTNMPAGTGGAAFNNEMLRAVQSQGAAVTAGNPAGVVPPPTGAAPSGSIPPLTAS
ncbi:MAG: rod-binding protein [Desulfovibrio sp.]|jgi:Rod binding domain-containing protein|nr:rod-binding protein [Desulfovibrio sp.]